VDGERAQPSGLAGALGALARVVAFTGLLLLGLILFQIAFSDAWLFLGVRAWLVDSAAILVLGILAGILLLRLLDRRPPGALGFAWTTHTPREIGLGLAIGLGAISAAAILLLVTGALRYTSDAGTVQTWLRIAAIDFGIFAVAAAAEEVLFRGYPFQALVRGIGAPAATLFASIGFAFAHWSNPNVDLFALLNIALAGVLLSAAYLRTYSLWFATAVHLGWNWGMAALFDLPVSGLELFDTPLYEPMVRGPAWLGGGAFGPEAGRAGSFAFLLAFIAVLRLPSIRVAPEMIARRPLPERKIA
jgi:membrane protease YdiL (CAAX protease family)